MRPCYAFLSQAEEHHAPALLPWVWDARPSADAASPKDGDGSMPGGSSTAGSDAPGAEERVEVGSGPKLLPTPRNSYLQPWQLIARLQ